MYNLSAIFENKSSFDMNDYKDELIIQYADMCFEICMASRVSTLKIILRDDCPELAGKVKMDIDIEEVCILCNIFGTSNAITGGYVATTNQLSQLLS